MRGTFGDVQVNPSLSDKLLRETTRRSMNISWQLLSESAQIESGREQKYQILSPSDPDLHWFQPHLYRTSLSAAACPHTDDG